MYYAGNNILDKDNRLAIARSWLKRARRDYRGFEKVVGQQYLRSRKDLPDDPALAIYLLQQACEKAVKAVAIASGEFDGEVLISKYGHDSLMLFADISLKLLDIPFVELAWRGVKREQRKTSKKMLSPREVRNRLHNLKLNIKRYEERPPDVPDWLKEFATLPSDPIKQVVTMLLGLHKTMQSAIFKMLEPNLQFDVRKLLDYMKKPNKLILEQALAPSFRSRKLSIDKLDTTLDLIALFTGGNFRELLAQAIDKEPLDLKQGKVKIGKRSAIEENFLSFWALCALMFLAAFTFAHEAWTRYPKLVSSQTGQTVFELDCDSYSADLGIVSCLRDLGSLARITLTDIEQMLDTISGIFSYFGRDAKPPKG